MKLLIASAFTTLLVATASAHPLTQRDLYGESVQPSAAARTIVVNDNTKYVTVVSGETAHIVIAGHDYVWKFDGVKDVFPLKDVLPPGALQQSVMVYVAPDLDKIGA